MCKFSIITPVFNTEKYLPDCIESVISQTFSDFELLIVNDGSTDSSLQIAKRYHNSDNRIIIYSKENGGQGIARNFAMSKASGEYILFLDSDDWLEPDALLRLYEKFQKENPDIIIFNVYKHFDETGIKDRFRYINCYYNEFGEKTFSPKDAISSLFKINALPFKAYRRDFLLDKDIKYSKTRFIEDSEFCIKAFLCAEKISCLDEFLLNYRVHKASTSFKAHKNIDAIKSTFFTCEKIFEQCKFDDSAELLYSFLHNRMSQLFYYFLHVEKPYKKKYFNMFKEIAVYIDAKYGCDFILKNTMLNRFKLIVSSSYEQYRIISLIRLIKIFLPKYFEI